MFDQGDDTLKARIDELEEELQNKDYENEELADTIVVMHASCHAVQQYWLDLNKNATTPLPHSNCKKKSSN